MFKGVFVPCLLCAFFFALPVSAQYKGDDIPGFLGLHSGTQAPPGLYVGNVVWVYPTSTVKNDNGNKINQRGSLTSTADVILIELVTYKLFGGNIGFRSCDSVHQEQDSTELPGREHRFRVHRSVHQPDCARLESQTR